MNRPIDTQHPHIAAHRASSEHRSVIEASELCGCFYCLATFLPAEIVRWIYDDTALCPRRTIDSVIGSASGYPITEALLRQMRVHWFES